MFPNRYFSSASLWILLGLSSGIHVKTVSLMYSGGKDTTVRKISNALLPTAVSVFSLCSLRLSPIYLSVWSPPAWNAYFNISEVEPRAQGSLSSCCPVLCLIATDLDDIWRCDELSKAFHGPTEVLIVSMDNQMTLRALAPWIFRNC